MKTAAEMSVVPGSLVASSWFAPVACEFALHYHTRLPCLRPAKYTWHSYMLALAYGLVSLAKGAEMYPARKGCPETRVLLQEQDIDTTEIATHHLWQEELSP